MGAGDVTPLGLEALDMLRIESGLVFAGAEFDDQVDPFEAGIGFTVPKAKEDDYVGKEALAERREHPQRRLVGLELEGNEPAAHGECVHVNRHQVGVITSGTRSPILQDERALRGGGNRGRGRQARRLPEANPRDGRPLPVLRPGQDAAA
jgi:aminomethyltransferase